MLGREDDLDILAESAPVVNPLGRGYIISWPVRLFDQSDISRVEAGEFDEPEEEDGYY